MIIRIWELNNLDFSIILGTKIKIKTRYGEEDDEEDNDYQGNGVQDYEEEEEESEYEEEPTNFIKKPQPSAKRKLNGIRTIFIAKNKKMNLKQWKNHQSKNPKFVPFESNLYEKVEIDEKDEHLMKKDSIQGYAPPGNPAFYWLFLDSDESSDNFDPMRQNPNVIAKQMKKLNKPAPNRFESTTSNRFLDNNYKYLKDIGKSGSFHDDFKVSIIKILYIFDQQLL